jgi:hypothetical protein
VALIAGTRPATSVISVPTASEITTVRSATTVPAWGRPSPSAPKSALSSFASPKPSASPASEARTPMTAVSMITERSTCRRDPPRVRRVANSRVRWATVIESVLKMTNAPTNSAMPPKASSA